MLNTPNEKLALGLSLMLPTQGPQPRAPADAPAAPTACGPKVDYTLDLLLPGEGRQAQRHLTVRGTSVFCLTRGAFEGAQGLTLLGCQYSIVLEWAQLGPDTLGNALTWRSLWGQHSPYVRDGRLLVRVRVRIVD